jgi:hypothetical protein
MEHIHDPELNGDDVKKWFERSMERALGLHHRHTGDLGWADSDLLFPLIVGTAVSHAGWRAEGNKSEGGMGRAERAWRRGLGLGESRPSRK